MGADGQRADKAGWFDVKGWRGSHEAARPAQDEGSLR